MPHGADEKRHDAEWRHADAGLRNGEECRFGCDRDVAAGDAAGAAADSAAVYDRNRWLRQGVERDQHIAKRGRRARWWLPGRLAAAGGEVRAGAEVPAAAAQHDDAYVLVRAQSLELISEL